MSKDSPGTNRDHEAECIKLLSDAIYANQLDAELGLTHLQLAALRLLSTPKTHRLSENQQSIVLRFIEESMRNAPLNKALRQLQMSGLADDDIDPDIVHKMWAFSHHTRHIDQFAGAFDKLTKGHNDILNKIKPDEGHRLSLREFATLRDAAKTKETFDLLRDRITLQGRVAEHADKVEKTKKMLDNIATTYKQPAPTRPGSLLFDHPFKKAKEFEQEESLYASFIKHLVIQPSQPVKLSETQQTEGTSPPLSVSPFEPSARKEEFSLGDYLYSDQYILHVEKLISPQQIGLIKQLYGEDWQRSLHTMYAEIERQIHDLIFRKMAGVFLGNPPLKQAQSGSLQTPDVSMICSEFVGMTIIAAMKELEVRLKAKLQAQHLPVPESLITLPFSAHEKAHTLTPESVIDILSKNHAIEKIALPGVASRYQKD